MLIHRHKMMMRRCQWIESVDDENIKWKADKSDFFYESITFNLLAVVLFFFHPYFLLRRETVFSSLMPSYECLRMSYECDCMNLSDVRMECALKPFQEAFIVRFEMFSVRKMFVAVYRLRTMDRIECQCSAPLMTNMNWCSGLVCENHKI